MTRTKDGVANVSTLSQSDSTQRTYQRNLDFGGFPQRKQTQKALNDQLGDLREIANRLGLYDAADHLGRVLEMNRQRTE